MKLVSVPLIPSPFHELSKGRFSFYPAIVGVAHNEWLLRQATWTDVVVANAKTWEELRIPRWLLGEVSSTEAPVRIVGLVKELEYREGVVLPYRRGVIQMPRAVNDFARPMPRPARAGRPAAVVAIRVEPNSESKVFRFLRSSLAAGFLICLGVVFVVRDAHLGSRFASTSAPALPPLSGDDDYASIVEKLGRPASDKWTEGPGGAGHRHLWYPRKGITVILAGENRASAHYERVLNRDGLVIRQAGPAIPQPRLAVPALR